MFGMLAIVACSPFFGGITDLGSPFNSARCQERDISKKGLAQKLSLFLTDLNVDPSAIAPYCSICILAQVDPHEEPLSRDGNRQSRLGDISSERKYSKNTRFLK